MRRMNALPRARAGSEISNLRSLISNLRFHISDFRTESLWACVLLAWGAACAFAASDAPTAKAGPYTITVERVARVLDLQQPLQARGSLVVTVSVKAADKAQADRLVELARDAVARDELLGVLKFREIRPWVCPEVACRRAEIVLSPASPMASALRSLSASLVMSTSTRSLRLDAPAVAGGSAKDPAGSLTVTVDSAQAGKDARGKPAQMVRFTIAVAPEAADLPWLSESIVLTDDRGMAHAALSETRTFEYAGEGQRLAAVKVTAFFASLPEGRRPKALRYTVQRAVGIEVLPYQFRNLPLP